MPAATREPRGPLVIAVPMSAWRERARSGVPVRVVARIPYGQQPADAGRRLAEGAATLLRSLLPALDGGQQPRSGRVFPVKSAGSAHPHAVGVEFFVSREMERALLDRRDGDGWLPLPQPWGAPAALFAGDPHQQVREVRLEGLPLCLELPYLQELLCSQQIDVRSLEPLTDSATGFPRCDAAVMRVPSDTKLPSDIKLADAAGRSTLASIRVRPLSQLPPLPADAASPAAAAGGASYAGVVAGRGAPRGGVPPPPQHVVAAATATVAAAAPTVAATTAAAAVASDSMAATAAAEVAPPPSPAEAAPAVRLPARQGQRADKQQSAPSSDGRGGRSRSRTRSDANLQGGSPSPARRKLLSNLRAGRLATRNSFEQLAGSEAMDAEGVVAQQQQEQQQPQQAAVDAGAAAVPDGGGA